MLVKNSNNLGNEIKKKKRILSCCVATATEYLIKTKSILETTPLGARTVMMLHRMCPQSTTEVPLHCYLWGRNFNTATQEMSLKSR